VSKDIDARVNTCYNVLRKGGIMKTSELIKILKKNNCYFVEHGKEHDKWHSDTTGKNFVVPRHPSKEIATGTLNRILKYAGIK